MKGLIKTALASGALIASSLASASVVVNYNSNAAAGEAAFMAFLAGPTVVEDFNSLGTAPTYGTTDQNSWEDHAASYSTNVGTFALITAGQAGSNLHNNHLMIESSRTGEYGREALASDAQDLWLDSNDARQVTWTFDNPATAGMNAFGFFMADASDVGATLTLMFDDGTYSDSYVISPYLASGNMGYVSVKSSMSIMGATLSFNNSNGNDGWGIDDVTVGRLPEPGTFLLLGLGLLGLGAARRRVKN
ncbi:PEP-CTERM sorting domain-containing protein [Simiduia sp. 21SJ11W-1]|uniref:PEP-CTERM sorting domain-containing protein n=1 Tax=Simiduia sp. 21SJ11W-1 TaxID=2909669 RepID=UPI00209D6777|nr:PEP-CTERM sorting domain-containing protein [Simiduia sp. 21SJ11W-1]UTA47358.1 PEP-CTERM sorting domain-containing protein [Simiduia sp. 21SJ11W-1]